MRLWSLHPMYLDSKGLTACWREALLAQAVLSGKTKGYKNHPQLLRFSRRLDALRLFMLELWYEADHRGFKFDAAKIGAWRGGEPISVTKGQLEYEFDWLQSKLETRDPVQFAKNRESRKFHRILSNEVFRIVNGPIAEWEKVK